MAGLTAHDDLGVIARAGGSSHPARQPSGQEQYLSANEQAGSASPVDQSNVSADKFPGYRYPD
jgi:hypothetical protein